MRIRGAELLSPFEVPSTILYYYNRFNLKAKCMVRKTFKFPCYASLDNISLLNNKLFDDQSYIHYG